MSIRTTNFDALAAATPLDRQASVIRDGSGDIWREPDMPSNWAHWKAPPPAEGKLPAGRPNYAGAIFGRLSVIRYHGKSGLSNPQHVWLVRCSCGDYEVRREKSIAKALAGGVAASPDFAHSCKVCEQVQIIQGRARKANTQAARKTSAALLDRMAEG